MSFVYLQKTRSAEETLEGKEVYERFSATRGIQIEAYHADNGVFRAYKWLQDCNKKSQNLKFAGVNAHHSNGMAEKRIKELQLTRKTLTHASQRWKGAIIANFYGHMP
jgi:hypothetical protein